MPTNDVPPHEPGREVPDPGLDAPANRSLRTRLFQLSTGAGGAVLTFMGVTGLAYGVVRTDLPLVVLSVLIGGVGVVTWLTGRAPGWVVWLGRRRPIWVVLLLVGAALAGLVSGFLEGRDDAKSQAATDWRLHFEISIPFGGGSFPNQRTLGALEKVDDAVTEAVEGQGLGEWEGQSVGAGTYDIGLFGDDQSAVVKVIEQVLRTRGAAQGTVIEITKNDDAAESVATLRL